MNNMDTATSIAIIMMINIYGNPCSFIRTFIFFDTASVFSVFSNVTFMSHSPFSLNIKLSTMFPSLLVLVR